jgi:glycosyltransferase involved in cell wall biosynthesis
MTLNPERLPISVIVLTHNEEDTLPDCLASLAAWSGEIFVVDSGSTDRTREIAREFTDEIVEHAFETYGAQRNWAQDELPLTHDWVLHVDADERVSDELAAAMRRFFASGDADRFAGTMFARRTIFIGRWIRHGGQYPVFHRRLFRRSAGRCEDRLYDQHFLVRGPVARLKGDLVNVLTPDLDLWTVRHLRWAGVEAREMLQLRGAAGTALEGRLGGDPIAVRRWLRTRVFARSPIFARAFGYFIYRYIFRLGFLDGTEGLIFHFLHGCWYRFYVDARIWEMRRK